jgi:hypothetical protein
VRRLSRGVAASLFAATTLVTIAPAARAIPPPVAPRSAPSPTAATVVAGATLPYGSTLLFVLDDKIDSGSTRPASVIHMHLKDSLIVAGSIVAPAGTPATLAIITTQGAQSGDVDGAVQIHLDPLALPGGTPPLPMRAYHEYLNIELTSGQQSTRSATDTVADIFVPYHVIYRIFRRGRQFVLPVGSVLRAQTAATIDASDPSHVVLSTPPPFLSNYDTPHAELTAPPLYTPAPTRPKPLPRGKPTLPPTPPPTPEPTVTP